MQRSWRTTLFINGFAQVKTMGTKKQRGTGGIEPAAPDATAFPAAGERLFTRDFVMATLANFTNSFGTQMLVATMPVYVVSLGGGPTAAGMVSGAVAMTALLFRPLMGWLVDSWRRRPLVLIGTSCYGFASIIYFLAGTIPLLLAGRFVHGFGLSCYTTASNAYIADVAPRARRGEAVGLFAAAQAVGLIIGPAIGFLLIDTIGFKRLFTVSGGLAFITFFISLFARERRVPGKVERARWSVRTGIVSVDALPMGWMAICMGMGFGAVSAFIAIFARDRGFPNPGFYFMIQALALIVSRVAAGRLSDRYDRAVVIIPGLVLGAVALALLPLANGAALFVISASLFGFGFGAAQPATMALLIDRVRPAERGLAVSTYYAGFDTGVFVGSFMLGVVSQRLGFGVMWPLAAGCVLLGLAGFLPSGRRKKVFPDAGNQ